jgi:hypothetical protein
MFLVELVCSDVECAACVEQVGDPDRLVSELCDCDCTLQIVSVSAVEVVGVRTPLERARARRAKGLSLAA